MYKIWSAPLFRGYKNIQIEGLLPDVPANWYYGKGIYFSPSITGAARWVANGIITESVPEKPLKLLVIASEAKRKDWLKNLPVDVDGVYLSHPNQEGGEQIILRSSNKLKRKSYWNWTGNEPNYSFLFGRKKVIPKSLSLAA